MRQKNHLHHLNLKSSLKWEAILEKYLDQIQIYLNNYNVKKDSNENINLNKVQLLECLQMLLNSKWQPNFKSKNYSYKNLENSSPTQNTKNKNK